VIVGLVGGVTTGAVDRTMVHGRNKS